MGDELEALISSPEEEEPNVEDLVAEYRDIRDALAEKRHEYQEYEASAKDRMDRISMKLREVADRLGVTSFKTRAGTAYRTLKERYSVANWNDLVEYVKATDNFQVFEKRVGKLACKEIHETTGQLPPGVDYSAEVEFQIRKS